MMNLSEACEAIQIYARHMEAIGVIAQAVGDKALFEQQVREAESRAHRLRDEEAETKARLAGLEGEAAAGVVAAKQQAAGAIEAAKEEAAGIIAKAKAEATRINERANASANSVAARSAEAEKAAGKRLADSEVSLAAAEKQLATLAHEIAKLEARRETLKAALKSEVAELVDG